MPFKVIITSPVQVLRLVQAEAPDVMERYTRVQILQIVAQLQGDNVESYSSILQALQRGHVVELQQPPQVPAMYLYQINAKEWFIAPY